MINRILYKGKYIFIPMGNAALGIVVIFLPTLEYFLLNGAED